MKVAVVGATGLVGQKMLQVLEERNLPIDELIVAASERSIGKKTLFKGKEHTLISVEDAIEKRPDIAIFSAGADASLKYAPLFAAKGTYVVGERRRAGHGCRTLNTAWNTQAVIRSAGTAASPRRSRQGSAGARSVNR